MLAWFQKQSLALKVNLNEKSWRHLKTQMHSVLTEKDSGICEEEWGTLKGYQEKTISDAGITAKGCFTR